MINTIRKHLSLFLVIIIAIPFCNSALASSDDIEIYSPVSDIEVPYGLQLKAVFGVDVMDTASQINVSVNGKSVESFVKDDEKYNLYKTDDLMTNAKTYCFAVPISTADLPLQTGNCVLTVSLTGSDLTVTEKSVNFTVTDLPKKSVKVDNADLNTFTTNITSSTAEFVESKYNVPIKYSKNTFSGTSYALKSITGTSGTSGDYAMQLYNGKATSGSGTYVVLYCIGKITEDNKLKNDRIIYELDTLVSQSDAEIQIRKIFSDNENYKLFNTDGTICESGFQYSVGEWKHMLVDLNYPGNSVTLYYDGMIVDQYTMTTSQGENGTAMMQFNLINSTADTAAFAFDNINIYTVAPYAAAVKYSYGTNEYSSAESNIIPTDSSSIVLPLTALFNDADNVASHVTLKKDGASIGNSLTSYDITGNVITISLDDSISPGEYTVEFASGLTMEQQIGSGTSGKSVVSTPCTYSLPLTFVEANNLTLSADSSGNYTSEIYYHSDSATNATMIIAAYGGNYDCPTLQSVTVKECHVVAGLNKLILTHKETSAHIVKAMLWSDTKTDITPLALHSAAVK